MSREKEKFHTLLRLPGNRANDLLAAPRTTALLLFGVHHNRRVTIEVKSLLLELADELDTPSCWLAARSVSDQAVDLRSAVKAVTAPPLRALVTVDLAVPSPRKIARQNIIHQVYNGKGTSYLALSTPAEVWVPTPDGKYTALAVYNIPPEPRELGIWLLENRAKVKSNVLATAQERGFFVDWNYVPLWVTNPVFFATDKVSSEWLVGDYDSVSADCYWLHADANQWWHCKNASAYRLTRSYCKEY